MDMASAKSAFEAALPRLLGEEGGLYALVTKTGNFRRFEHKHEARIAGYEEFGVSGDFYIGKVSEQSGKVLEFSAFIIS